MMAWAAVVLAIVLAGFAEASPKPHATVLPMTRIDVNAATLEELLKAPGMTRTWAVRIIRFRPYHTKQDLVDQGIVPDRIYDRIKDYVIAHREKQ